MGSGQSARRLTIDNEDAGSFIGISESVAERLSQNLKQANAGVVNEVRSNAVTEPLSETAVTAPLSQDGDTPVNSENPIISPQFTVTALQIQQQKVEELRNQDNYWQNRLKNLEQKHSQINDIINAEYKKAVQQLYSNGKKSVNVQDTVQPCKNSSEKVLKCYHEHPKEILKCSTLVEEFSNCVDERRARVIATRC